MPISIQEKIQPQAINEDLRQSGASRKPQQLDLFAGFNGIDDLATRVDFYHHDQNWTNRMILGDSLLVMTSLGMGACRNASVAAAGLLLTRQERKSITKTGLRTRPGFYPEGLQRAAIIDL